MQGDAAQIDESASGVGQATITLMAGFVGSRLAGLVRDIVIGRTFGTSRQLDAYLAAFRIPDLVFQLLAGAALGSAFIPVFTRYLVTGEEGEAWRLASAVFNLLLLSTLVVAGVAFGAAPWLIPLLVPGFSLADQELALGLTRIMLLSPIFFSVSGAAMAILQARRHFLLPALAPTVYNLAIIVGALWLSSGLGVAGLAVGVALGSALHFLVQLPGLGRVGMHFGLRLELSHSGVREVGRLMVPRVLGLGVVQLNFVVITLLASMLAPGSLAALNYAWVLAMLPLGVFGVAPATALFPTMAEEAARDDWAQLRQTLSRGLRGSLFLVLPASLVLILLREPLVTALFQRGQFEAVSTAATSWALLFYALGLPAHAALEMLSRGFYARRDTRTPVAWGAVAMGMNLGLGLALMRLFGHGGLALALSLSTTVEAVILFFLLGAASPLRREMLAFGGRVSLALAFMALVLVALGALQAPFPVMANPWLMLSVGLMLGGGVYLLAARALGTEEVRYLTGVLGGRWLPKFGG